MMRFWLGLFLLACSWLMGTDYFRAPNWPLWAGFVVGGVMLICWSQSRAEDWSTAKEFPLHSTGEGQGQNPLSSRFPRLAPLLIPLLLLPAIVFAPWPHRLAPMLVAIGAALTVPAVSWRRLRAVAHGNILAGILLWAQDLALLAYKSWTARSHELPWPFAKLLAGVARLLDVEAALEQTNLMLPTMRHTHALGATWEFLVDPAMFCFLAGGLIVLLLAVCARGPNRSETNPQTKAGSLSRSAKRRLAARTQAPFAGPPWAFLKRLEPVGLFLLAAALWLPLRAGLLLGLYLHRALRTDYEASFNLMNQFWNPWLQMLWLLPLAVLSARWLRGYKTLSVRLPPHLFTGARLDHAELAATEAGRAPVARFALTVGLTGLAAALITLGIHWDPVGERKGGRVAIDEFHSKWEPTDRPFDTEWYGHLSGYNYACIYDYCSRYYQMSRLTNALNDAALGDLDVLVVKVPTERYAREEVEAIVRFVERGGGLLLIGEHTDVFGTGYNLNTLARRFGFVFRYDCLFGIESFFDQFYRPSFVPHPVVQHLRGMDFATSCSIEPRGVFGRSVITSTGLKNSLADYHVSNYYPPAADHAAMRYGAFIQLWSVRQGRGRVLAFTDSTIFSNFSAFEPGKSELMLGMLEWLNHQDRVGRPRLVLSVLGVILLALGLVRILKHPQAFLPAVAATAFFWAFVCAGLVRLQRQLMPAPVPQRPYVQVTIDRTACSGPLSKNGFIEGKSDGFGIFERWILRLGYFNRRQSGLPALAGDLVVYFFPNKPVSKTYREALVRYVESGGRVLILDAPENKHSTAADLLQPFQLAQRPVAGSGGTLSGLPGFPSIPIESANEVTGGQTLFRLADKPVASLARFGKGTVTLVGFGSRFTDAHMGVTGDVEPNEELKKVFQFQYALVRGIVGDKLAPTTAAVDTKEQPTMTRN